MRLPFVVEPIPDESLMSWVLRSSAENMLPSPWHFFKLAGIPAGQMSGLAADPKRMAALSGVDEAKLREISCYEATRRAAVVPFRGVGVCKQYIRKTQPQVCPACISEMGYARGIWDLFSLNACVFHRVRLISTCPRCHNRLSWLRPNLSMCRCSCLISHWPMETATKNEVAVSALVEATMTRSAKPWLAHVGGEHPLLDAATAAPVNYTLALLSHLCRPTRVVYSRFRRCDAASWCEVVGELLLDWPGAYLSRLAQKAAAVQWQRVKPEDRLPFVIVGEIRSLRGLGYRHGFDDLGMHRTLMEFLRQCSMEALLDARTIKNMRLLGLDATWITRCQAAERLGVDRRTFDRIAAGACLQTRTKEAPTPTAYFLLSEVDSLSPDFRVVERRRASDLLGLPVSVAQSLRALRLLPEVDSVRAPRISQADIAHYVDRWKGLSVTSMDLPARAVSLLHALRWPCGRADVQWKVELVRRVLSQEIPVFGISLEPRPNAVLNMDEVLAIKASFERCRLTLGDAANVLSTSKLDILRLLADRRLKVDLSGPMIKVERRDVEDLKRDLAPLRAEGEQEGLKELLRSKGIPVFGKFQLRVLQSDLIRAVDFAQATGVSIKK